MSRRSINVINANDSLALIKALKDTELNFSELFEDVKTLKAQRAFVPVEESRYPPDNAPVPVGITLTENQDGSITVELTWTYIQGKRPATQIVVLIKRGSAPLNPPVVWEDDVYTLPATATKARLDLPGEHNYRFGVAAARGTRDGLAVGVVQSPTANPDWTDITGGKATFGGISPNLCPNPDFETPNYLWVLNAPGSGSVTYPTTDPKYGIRHAELVVTISGTVQLRMTHPALGETKTIPVIGGKVYSFAVWAKRTAGTATATLQVVEWDSGGGVLSLGIFGAVTGAAWERITGERTLNVNTAFLGFRVGTLTTGTGTFRFDGAQVCRCTLANLPDFDGPQLDHQPFVPTMNLTQFWLGSRLLSAVGAVVGDITLVEDAWTQTHTVAVTIFPAATTTHVLVTASIGVQVAVTVAGRVEIQWRLKRNGAVIRTSFRTTMDTVAVGAEDFEFAGMVYTDTTPGTGTVTYSIEMWKNELAGTHTVTAKIPGQIAALPWSN